MNVIGYLIVVKNNMKCGFDIGGTKTEFCVLSNDNEIQFRERLFNGDNCEDNLKNISFLIEKSKINKIESIGFSLKALVDSANNRIIKSSLGWLNNDFLDKIRKKYNCEIKVQNDANCFALAEHRMGAGKNYKTGFYLILGTGVGGATIFNGQIFDGMNNFAGEVGHIIYNGGNITYEDMLSGIGFLQNYNKKHQTNLQSPQEIMQKYSKNDGSAIEYFNSYIETLALLLQSICCIVAPDIIVVGGGLSNIPKIYEVLPKYLVKMVGPQTPVICQAILGDSAGVIGASQL